MAVVAMERAGLVVLMEAAVKVKAEAEQVKAVEEMAMVAVVRTTEAVMLATVAVAKAAAKSVGVAVTEGRRWGPQAVQ
jgi:hypothetical protein